MKKCLCVVGCFMLGAAMAQNQPGAQIPNQQQGQNFDQIKQKQLERVGQRLSDLQSLQSCLQGASDAQALHQCHIKFEQEHMRGSQSPFRMRRPQQQGQ